MNDLIKIENLRVDFMTVRGIVYAVQGVDYSVKRGEIHGLVGESGCGKSVSSKTLLRLHDEEKTRYSGSVQFDGENGKMDILKLSDRDIRRLRGKEISMIFQDPMTSLNPIMKAGEQVAEVVRKKLGMKKKEAKEYVLEIFSDVGITPAKKRYEQYPFEMSGGMLQRIMIAMALSTRPKLLIADEPTTALDVTIQAQILKLIKELAKKNGTSVIIITHNLGVVAEICDSVSVMYAGKIVEHASVTELFDHPKHPYTKALLASNPKAADTKKYMETIPGTPPLLYEEFKGCPFAPRCKSAEERCHSKMPPFREVEEGHSYICFK